LPSPSSAVVHLRVTHVVSGWRRYSGLVWWQLLSTAVLGGYWWLAAAGITGPHTGSAVVLAVAFTVLVVVQLGYGAVNAQRARRYGCW